MDAKDIEIYDVDDPAKRIEAFVEALIDLHHSMEDYIDMEEQEDYEEYRSHHKLIFILVFIYMIGQMLAAALTLYGFPSNWF